MLLSFMLFCLLRMHERDTATKKVHYKNKLDSTLQTTLGHVVTQRLKQNFKWKTKVTNISKSVSMLQIQLIPLEDNFS